ncbi:hypothetical protein F6V25_03710 [Oryzomonas japonica]|uniref:Flp pilus-assembly TadG-like N-terminal domain-containing protein n=1 Tax=Oryzomonas japonica TaxID=2603858 RepID=A0A7J4ZT54_9BACT|nr:pilus assembly protein TadG-related protein [Oryzomonas japonica]KAB0666536.1 hypothetical protein F6V25_03710 [Oryzomonas japonica]
MDAARRVGQFSPLHNERGVAVVYIAVALVVLILIAGLAIDLGYMYLTKAQLQNAADAGALAGAQKMKQVGLSHDASQALSRTEAQTFAQKNNAANASVQLASDGSNTLSNGNDITVGHWDSLTRTYTPGAAGTNIFNAIQVRTRRTALSPAGPVNTFLAKIRPELHSMEAASQAIATIPARAGNFTSFCSQACGVCNYDPSTSTFDLNDASTWPTACQQTVISQPAPDPSGLNSADKFAWTTLLDNPSSSSALSDLVRTGAPNQDVCGKDIYTTMGQDTNVMRDMASNMYDPYIDNTNKTIVSGNVTEWWVIVPVTESCPPGSQGGFDPKIVTRYAKIRIQAICVNGVAGYTGYKDGSGECSHAWDGNIVYDRIMCVGCADASLLYGTKVNLVK